MIDLSQSNEEKLLIRKLNDKANSALYYGYTTYTNFLDTNEQSVFLSHLKELNNVSYDLFGGYDESERKVLAFYADDAGKKRLDFPISIIHIKTQNQASTLTHRDYLGAIMSLGIERHKIGDILCYEHGAYVFCINNIAEHIKERLITIKTTSVSAQVELMTGFELKEQSYELIKGTVSSLRLDSIIKLSFCISRSIALDLIKSKKAYVNSRLVEKGSASICEGNIISLRGYGKIKLKTIGNLTKKGRTYVEILKYK